jgi:hypothetical protein
MPRKLPVGYTKTGDSDDYPYSHPAHLKWLTERGLCDPQTGLPGHHLLLAEFEHGRLCYVIAYLEGEDLDPFAGLSNFNPAT